MTLQSRRRLLGVLAICAASATLAACSGTPEPEGDFTLTIAVDAITEGGWDQLQGVLAEPLEGAALFDSLMSWDYDTDTGTPRLATGYTVADDRLSMQIDLRDDVDFVEGSHFDAAALEAFFEALIDSDYVALGAFAAYEPEFTTTDDYTLDITTVKPIYAGDFLRSLFGFVLIQSPVGLEDPERALAEPLGSGPYVIAETDPGIERTLVRNPDYWDPEAYPYDTIVLKVLPDSTAALNALKSGQVDAARITIPAAAEAEAAGLSVFRGGGISISLIVQNPGESTLVPLRDQRVRQAMMLAFDRQGIADSVYLGFGEVSSQMFTEGQAQWIEGGDERYGYDPERARELMAEAGYADGFDVTIPAGTATTLVQPAVQQALADIGIRVTYETIPDLFAHYEASMNGSHPLSLFDLPYVDQIRQIGEEFPGLGRFVVPDQKTVDLLADIMGPDAERSIEASQELGEYMLEVAWFIPIGKPANLWASDTSVVIDIEPTQTLTNYPALDRFRPAD